MKLDLCKVFGVKEGQHFWINFDKEGIEEVCIKNNQIYFYNNESNCIDKYEFFDINNLKDTEIHYTKPVVIKLDDNTKNFLKLINKKYKWLAPRKEHGIKKIYAYSHKPHKVNDVVGFGGMDAPTPSENTAYMDEISNFLFDIDLSFIKCEDDEPYKISDLLGDDND